MEPTAILAGDLHQMFISVVKMLTKLKEIYELPYLPLNIAEMV